MVSGMDSAPQVCLDDPVSNLPGVGPKRAALLGNLGIRTLRELVLHLPRAFEDRSHPTPIAEAQPGAVITIAAEVVQSRNVRLRGRNSMAVATLRDESGEIGATFFGRGFLANTAFRPGARGFFTGTVETYKGLALKNPEYEMLAEDGSDERLNAGRIVPIYRLTEKITQRLLRQLIAGALDAVAGALEEPLPEALRAAHGFPEIAPALREAHFPETLEAAQRARSRFAYEELLGIQLGVLGARRARQGEGDGVVHHINGPFLKALGRALPFTLTNAQERAISDILRDMAASQPMARLLQGDVGCGKTAVALHAIAAAADGGFQTALMAPTEVLAEQHAIHLRDMLEPIGIRVATLFGAMRGAAAIRKRIAAGEVHVVVGTQALIQEKTAFHELGLAIIDEQHRFGVAQRARLQEKGRAPDLLHMTATPIPRTLALTVYGGMDLTVIDELPPGREPVKTRRIPDEKIPGLYGYVREQAAAGFQTYIVCPRVEESEDRADLTSAITHFEQLSAGPLEGLRTELLHGRLDSSEKDEVMHRFKNPRNRRPLQHHRHRSRHRRRHRHHHDRRERRTIRTYPAPPVARPRRARTLPLLLLPARPAAHRRRQETHGNPLRKHRRLRHCRSRPRNARPRRIPRRPSGRTQRPARRRPRPRRAPPRPRPPRRPSHSRSRSQPRRPGTPAARAPRRALRLGAAMSGNRNPFPSPPLFRVDSPSRRPTVRILFLCQYFPPEMGAPAARTFEHAREWVRAGHEVTVVCGFPNHPDGIVPPRYRGHLLVREDHEGVRVLRCWLYATPNRGVVRRSLSFMSFMASAVFCGAFLSGPCDVVAATSPQMLCGLAGWLVACAKRRPFVLEVRDLWPKQIVDLGVIRNRAIIRILYALERFLYRRARAIVTVAEATRREIAGRGVPEAKLHNIPNGIDPDFFAPRPPGEDLVETLGARNKTVVLYIGTHGLSQGLEALLDAARILAEEPRYCFVFVGAGAERDGLIARAQDMGLENTLFLSAQPKEKMPAFYAAADVCAVPLRKREAFRYNIPSKMFEIMACAKPIVLGVEGQAKQLLEAADAGIAVEPENAQAFAEAIRTLANDAALRARFGKNGRKHVLEHYTRARNARAYLDVFDAIKRTPSESGE